MTWLLRACPRCGGSLYREKDRDGDNIVCLQCSASIPLEVALESLPIDQPDRVASYNALSHAHLLYP